MKSFSKLTKNLGKWFSKDSGEPESPLLLQSLEDRVLYSAVPLPVDNVDAPVENTDLDDVQFIEIESNTTLPIGEAIAEDASSQFLAQDSYSTESAAASADATLDDLEELVNSFEQNDVASTEEDEPRTAMGLATATPDAGASNFFVLEEGQSFTIDYDFLGNPSANFLLPFGQGFSMTQAPASGEILVDGVPLELNVQQVTVQEIQDGKVVFVPDADFVGNDGFRLQGNVGIFSGDFSILYEGVADDGVNVFGDEFAPVDGSAPVFEANTLQSETHVASLSNGGYVVVASLGDSAGQLQFQMFDDAGVATESDVITAADFRVDHVNVVGLDDGEFLVAFEGEEGGARHLNIQRFDANGQPVLYGGTQLQLSATGSTNSDDISLEYLGEDRFIVSFIQAANNDIASFVVSIAGTQEEFFGTTAVQPANDITSVHTALLSDGGYVLARVENDGSTNSIFASTFDPGSHLQQQDIQLAIDITGNDVAIVGTTDNGFAVVWQGTPSDPTGIYVATFDRLGNAVGAPTFVSEGTTAVSAAPDIVALDDGSFVVSHTAVGSNGTQEIIGQRLNADLTALGNPFTINSFSGEDQTDAEIALLNNGTLVSTFKSGDQVSPATILQQRLQMSISGNEDTWIPLNSMIGISPSSTTEVFETLTLTGFPIGSKIQTGLLDGAGNPVVHEFFFVNDILTFNSIDIGQLSFMAPEDTPGTFEATAVLTTNDGASIAPHTTNFQVVVEGVEDLPVFTNPTSFSVVEGNQSVGQVVTTDADAGSSVVYSIKTGTSAADGGLFSIDTAGNISFVVAPDFESPNSVAGSNTYTLTVIADDGNGVLVEQVITVNVTDENEAPTIIPPSSLNVDEEQTAVGNFTPSDVDSDLVTFSLGSGFGDSNLFQITPNGTLSFINAPDFEAPSDADVNNSYEVRVVATDEHGLPSERDVTVIVDDVNDLPVFTNPATFNVVEGNQSVGQVSSTDADSDPIAYSIKTGTGAADGALFSIDGFGNITFNSAPDFENPNSAAGSNTYTLTILADDGNGVLAEQVITVNVTDKNEAPTINPPSLYNADEEQTSAAVISASDVDSDSVTFSLASGIADSDLFQISPTGTLSFITAPDFEAPSDADVNNSYEVRVVATDEHGLSTERDIRVVVNDVNELPVFANAASFPVVEGNTVVGQVITTDPDLDLIVYSIKTGTGAADGALFSIDGFGNISFNSAPDFENPNSVSSNNNYTLTVLADDGNGGVTEQLVTVEVHNLNETPVIAPTSVISVNEGDTAAATISATDVDGDDITFSLANGVADTDLFQIDAQTGELSFITAPDYEAPLDTDGNNQYVVRVVATDENGATTNRAITVEVQNLNEDPVFAITPPLNVNEGNTVVGQVSATDPDNDSLVYSIKPATGDGALFTINSGGNISFSSAPDFENPNSVSSNNNYTLTVLADDGNGGVTEQLVTVEVNDLNETPVIAPTPVISVNEGDTAVTMISASDVDGDDIIFSLANGVADTDLFQIDAQTGELSFIFAPDYENPSDAGANNNYQVRVIATDEHGLASEQDVAVVVDNVNELPVFTNPTTFNIVEGNTQVGQATVNDPENDSIVFSITPGVGDGDLLSIDAAGNISFILPPDYENPISVLGSNEYTLTIVADDGNGELVENHIFVNVTNQNVAPVIAPTAGYTVTEGETEVAVVSTSDEDGDTVFLSVVPGSFDGDLFQIAADGTLSFISPPDFETSLAANGGNTYTLIVSAADQNGGVTERLVKVDVLDVNEAPVIVADSNTIIDEGENFVQTVSVTDPDGDAVTLSIVDDGNPAVFTIDGLGNISFINTPDFEIPFDVDGNNIDLVTVLADDGNGGTSTQTITVTLNDVNEAPVFVGNNQQLSLEQDESSTETFDLVTLFADPEDQSMTLEIVGGADANLFHIVNNELALIDAPELIGPQSPTYEVQVLANDGVNDSITKTVNLKINNINDAPVADDNSYPGSQNELDANASFGVPVDDRYDADGDAVSLVIAGDGADNSLFEIVNDRIQFIDPPTWENGGQNTYVVTTVLNDGTENSEIITFEITVENINDRPEITDIAPVVDSLEEFQLSQVGPGVVVADLNQATTFDKDGDPVTFTLDSVGQDNNLFYIDGNNKLRFASTPQLEGVGREDFNVSIVASDGQLNSNPQAISITVEDDTRVDVFNNGNDTNTDNDNDNPVPPATPTEDNPETSGNLVEFIPSTPVTDEKSTSQPPTQRRSDINGITAVSDLKTGDDDVFFDLTSDSVSYLFQFGAQGPQLVTQEIGDIMESRHTVVDMRLEESMLANYFWQGFEDSEDEFIRRNLEADTTTIVAASAGLSLGLVSYLRLAAMATTVVTQLPAWKTLDVAPLINAFDEDEAETIHQIVDA